MPDVGCIRAAAIWSNVVLPAPFGPSTTQRSSSATAQLTPSRMRVPPRTTVTSESCRTGTGPTYADPPPAPCTRGAPYRGVMHVPTLRRAALLAAWSTAALRGEVPAERAMDVVAADSGHLVFVDEEADPHPYLVALGRWRSAGIPGWRYLPVAPGDAPSLPGPSGFAARALEAGVALVATGGRPVGLVPTRTTTG